MEDLNLLSFDHFEPHSLFSLDTLNFEHSISYEREDFLSSNLISEALEVKYEHNLFLNPLLQ